MERSFSRYGECRTCLKLKNDLRPLTDSGISEMLMYCASIQVDASDKMPGDICDKMPGHICEECLNLVAKMYNFKQMCAKSESKLMQYIQRGFLPAERYAYEETRRAEILSLMSRLMRELSSRSMESLMEAAAQEEEFQESS